MKVIGVDFGVKRTGTAICDEKETICYPLKLIEEEDEEVLVKKIAELFKQNAAEMLVVGVAVNMNGSFGEKAICCKNFAIRLKEFLKKPVALWDERQTTLLASRYMIESNTNRRKKKKIVDLVAATIILEDFLAFKNNGNEIKLV